MAEMNWRGLAADGQHPPWGRVIDLDTGKEIPRVFWLDDTDSPWGHEYKAYRTDATGKFLTSAAGEVLTIHVRGARIKFVPFEED